MLQNSEDIAPLSRDILQKSNCAFLDLKWTFDGKQQSKINHGKKNIFLLICPRYNLIAFHE